MRRWLRWARLGAVGVAAALVALASLGAFYQAFATRADRRSFPAPGKLVDVGGYRLHIRCVGEGQPTVVLEAGALAMSSFWAWVQDDVGVHTRVCSYDRAGLGWSEPGPEPRHAVRSSEELHTLLARAGERPPYVLVGHSFGGLLVRVYADRHPQDVAGLVLVDSSHPDQESRLEKVLGKPSLVEAHMFALVPVLARLGIVRLLLPSSEFARRMDNLPPRQAAEVKAFFADASHQSGGKAEIAAWEDTAAQARSARPLGERPLVVISAEGTEPDSPEQRVRLEMQRELAALSSRSSHQILAGTTHASLLASQGHAAQLARAVRELVLLAKAR